MKVLITGGRKNANLDLALDSIALLHDEVDIDYIVHGDAAGYDTLADNVANELGIDRFKVPANWVKYSKGAGSVRNKTMLDTFPIDIVLAFPGRNGTADMVKQAIKRGITVIYAEDIVNGT